MSVGRVHAFQDLEALGYRVGLAEAEGADLDHLDKREELTRTALRNGATKAEADIRFKRGVSLGHCSYNYK